MVTDGRRQQVRRRLARPDGRGGVAERLEIAGAVERVARDQRGHAHHRGAMGSRERFELGVEPLQHAERRAGQEQPALSDVVNLRRRRARHGPPKGGEVLDDRADRSEMPHHDVGLGNRPAGRLLDERDEPENLERVDAAFAEKIRVLVDDESGRAEQVAADEREQ